jgi:JAB domain-containing protein similar to deubiquitination enzymes
MTGLQERILAAYEGGRHDELRRLQAEYRKTAVLSSRDRGGTSLPCRVIEKKQPASTQTRRHTAPAWYLQTENLPAKKTVTITSAAGEAINDLCFEARAELWEGIETGGFVYGSSNSIVAASRAGPRSECGVGYVELHFADAREHEERLGARLLGCWHAHPSPAEPEPSTDDIAGWSKAAELIGRQYVAVIVHDPHQLWVAPELRAWRVRRVNGRTVCEPYPYATKELEMPAKDYPPSKSQPAPKFTTWPPAITKAPVKLPGQKGT